MSRTKKRFGIVKVLLSVILAVVLLAAAAFLALTLMEYKPADVEALELPGGTDKVSAGQSLTVLSFNTGYAALGEEADFFMDGGKTTRPESANVVAFNMEGISAFLKEQDADICLLQEVDTGSKRSYGTDQVAYYHESLGKPYMFALNYSAKLVPYPIPDVLGRVSSSLVTFTSLNVADAQRVQLPIPFSWPMRCFNLKRCLLVSRIPVEGSDKELVVINLHLEAYDDGEGKRAQTEMLYDFLAEEHAKGNYVIAGGDFNQTFPGAYEYPATFEGCWMAGVLDANLPEGFSVVYGEGDSPTCRLLNVPYKGNPDPQYYIIDGFIVSDNLTVDSVSVVDCGFRYADHQPVRLEVTLAD